MCGRDVFCSFHILLPRLAVESASMQLCIGATEEKFDHCFIGFPFCAPRRVRVELRATAQTTGPLKNCFRIFSLKFFLSQTFRRDARAGLSLRRLLHEGGSEVYENLPLLLLLRQVLLHLVPQRQHPRAPGEGRRALGLQGTIDR